MLCRTARSGGLVLHLSPDQVDLGQDLGAEVLGHRVVPARASYDSFDRFFEPELTQTGVTLVEVLLDLGADLTVDLAVEVVVDAVEHLGTRHLVGRSAAHDVRSSSLAPAGTSPRSRA